MLKTAMKSHNSVAETLSQSAAAIEARVTNLEERDIVENKCDQLQCETPTSNNSAQQTYTKAVATKVTTSHKTNNNIPKSSHKAAESIPREPAQATSDKDPWQTVTPKRTHHRRKHGIIGNGKDSSLRCIPKVVKPRVANVFATRIYPETTEIDIKRYLKEKLNFDVKVARIETKFDTYASFHITCECHDLTVFMSGDLWPENIYVRRWREKRQNTADATTAKSK